MRKYFVLDTNVLLHNPNAIESFADNWVIIPISVIEELDHFKTHTNELGRNARGCIRMLDRLRHKGNLRSGVPLKNGGLLRIVMGSEVPRDSDLFPGIKDNHIIGCAYALQKTGEEVIFISKDINARIKAEALGLKTNDFEKQKVDFDLLYSGWRNISSTDREIREFHEAKSKRVRYNLIPNEFAILRAKGKKNVYALARYHAESQSILALTPAYNSAFEIRPRNIEQRMAMELLYNDDIRLVTLIGRAGTGKTLLALAVALQKVISEQKFQKVLVSRPIMPLGKDIGFLPGTKDDKLSQWMQPIFDNLKYLAQRKKDRKGKKSPADELINAEVLELEALTYIRGRSISNQYVIVDEAQNLTPHEIKTIISRAGEDTKMVLTGDPYQIDNPYLDASSNGLTYLVENMKGVPLFGHMTLTQSERSTLASIAADRL